MYYQCLTDTGKSLVQIDTETLKEFGNVTYEGDGFGPNVMFSDGTHLGHVAAGKDVSKVFSFIDFLLSEIRVSSQRIDSNVNNAASLS